MKFKEFINIYNFRNYRDDVKFENNKYDTIVVRVYFDTEIGSHHYIEFGIYDFADERYKQGIYEKFIDKKMLKRKIESMYFDYDLNTFCVYLGDDE